MCQLPDVKYNLLSVSKITSKLKIFATFYPKIVIMQDLSNGKVLRIGRVKGGLYFFKQIFDALNVACNISILLWHKRLGYSFKRALKHVHYKKNIPKKQSKVVVEGMLSDTKC